MEAVELSRTSRRKLQQVLEFTRLPQNLCLALLVASHWNVQRALSWHFEETAWARLGLRRTPRPEDGRDGRTNLFFHFAFVRGLKRSGVYRLDVKLADQVRRGVWKEGGPDTVYFSFSCGFLNVAPSALLKISIWRKRLLHEPKCVGECVIACESLPSNERSLGSLAIERSLNTCGKVYAEAFRYDCQRELALEAQGLALPETSTDLETKSSSQLTGKTQEGLSFQVEKQLYSLTSPSSPPQLHGLAEGHSQPQHLSLLPCCRQEELLLKTTGPSSNAAERPSNNEQQDEDSQQRGLPSRLSFDLLNLSESEGEGSASKARASPSLRNESLKANASEAAFASIDLLTPLEACGEDGGEKEKISASEEAPRQGLLLTATRPDSPERPSLAEASPSELPLKGGDEGAEEKREEEEGGEELKERRTSTRLNDEAGRSEAFLVAPTSRQGKAELASLSSPCEGLAVLREEVASRVVEPQPSLTVSIQRVSSAFAENNAFPETAISPSISSPSSFPSPTCALSPCQKVAPGVTTALTARQASSLPSQPSLNSEKASTAAFAFSDGARPTKVFPEGLDSPTGVQTEGTWRMRTSSPFAASLPYFRPVQIAGWKVQSPIVTKGAAPFQPRPPPLLPPLPQDSPSFPSSRKNTDFKAASMEKANEAERASAEAPWSEETKRGSSGPPTAKCAFASSVAFVSSPLLKYPSASARPPPSAASSSSPSTFSVSSRSPSSSNRQLNSPRQQVERTASKTERLKAFFTKPLRRLRAGASIGDSSERDSAFPSRAKKSSVVSASALAFPSEEVDDARLSLSAGEGLEAFAYFPEGTEEEAGRERSLQDEDRPLKRAADTRASKETSLFSSPPTPTFPREGRNTEKPSEMVFSTAAKRDAPFETFLFEGRPSDKAPSTARRRSAKGRHEREVRLSASSEEEEDAQEEMQILAEERCEELNGERREGEFGERDLSSPSTVEKGASSPLSPHLEWTDKPFASASRKKDSCLSLQPSETGPSFNAPLKSAGLPFDSPTSEQSVEDAPRFAEEEAMDSSIGMLDGAALWLEDLQFHRKATHNSERRKNRSCGVGDEGVSWFSQRQRFDGGSPKDSEERPEGSLSPFEALQEEGALREAKARPATRRSRRHSDGSSEKSGEKRGDAEFLAKLEETSFFQKDSSSSPKGNSSRQQGLVSSAGPSLQSMTESSFWRETHPPSFAVSIGQLGLPPSDPLHAARSEALTELKYRASSGFKEEHFEKSPSPPLLPPPAPFWKGDLGKKTTQDLLSSQASAFASPSLTQDLSRRSYFFPLEKTGPHENSASPYIPEKALETVAFLQGASAGQSNALLVLPGTTPPRVEGRVQGGGLCTAGGLLASSVHAAGESLSVYFDAPEPPHFSPLFPHTPVHDNGRNISTNNCNWTSVNNASRNPFLRQALPCGDATGRSAEALTVRSPPTLWSWSRETRFEEQKGDSVDASGSAPFVFMELNGGPPTNNPFSRSRDGASPSEATRS